MFKHIRIDIKRFREIDGSVGGFNYYVYSYGLHALLVYRFGRWLLSVESHPFCWPFLLLSPIYWISSLYVRLAYDIHLGLSSSIDSGLYIGHFGGIRIVKCRIGPYCSIHQEVRLLPTEGTFLGPQIGSRVWIGAHAQILGRINIGDGATIGAGALVTEDVKANNLILGNPARVIGKNYDNGEILLKLC